MIENKNRARPWHGLASMGITAVLVFTAVAGLGLEPQVPLIFGCVAAAAVAMSYGCTWNDILSGILDGMSKSLEAMLILLFIGMLIGVWIAAGTVPSMICYGLELLSARYFLFTAALICAMLSYAIGAWGSVGTVGLAFMGIGLALGLPAPLVAGSIVSGCYIGEIISPLSDATNLTAAVVGKDVFSLTRRSLPMAMAVFVMAEVLYLLLGMRWSGADTALVKESTQPLLESIRAAFCITPLSLIPVALMFLCIVRRAPVIPSMLVGIISGMICAMLLQGDGMPELCRICSSGYVSQTGDELLDKLLSAGGIHSMMDTISIILIAMSFGGLMQRTGQVEAMCRPVLSRVRSMAGLKALTVLSCVGMNALLPDQYLGISVPGQLLAEEYDRRGGSRLELGQMLLNGGAITSPLIPWNTCGIYCFSILGVGAGAYFPYALLNCLLPLAAVIIGFIPRQQLWRKKTKSM